jgi:hypothetical protein
MRRHGAVGPVDLRVVERGLFDGALQIVGDDEPRQAAAEPEQAHMRADPVRQPLRPAGLRIGVVRSTEHGDEDLGRPHLAGDRIDDGDLLAGVIDEQLVAGDVVLPHGRCQAMLEVTVELAEAAVAVPVGMASAVFFPEHHEVDAWSLHLAHQCSPIRLGASAQPGLGAGASE